jgi:NTE family protein
MKKIALILSGGGARAAYQVGVLRAISEILPDVKVSPFSIICGTSAGAINAAKLATSSDDFPRAVALLEKLWSTLTSDQVHRVGFGELVQSTLLLFASFLHRGISRARPLALLDNSPLYHLLYRNIDMLRLPMMIEQGHLHALSITALGYSSGQSISFFQGHTSIKPWRRARRIGLAAELNHRHLTASSALPGIFPAVRINREYFGDGAIRQTAPMSAALHLGADKLFIIGVSGNAANPDRPVETSHSPSLAQIMAQVLNSAFIDSMDEDIEMLERFNVFIRHLDDDRRQQLRVRPVEVLTIMPTLRFDELAGQHVESLHSSMKTLLTTIGATRKGGGSSLASYLLFESSYTSALIDAGYRDGMSQRDAIRQFIAS